MVPFRYMQCFVENRDLESGCATKSTGACRQGIGAAACFSDEYVTGSTVRLRERSFHDVLLRPISTLGMLPSQVECLNQIDTISIKAIWKAWPIFFLVCFGSNVFTTTRRADLPMNSTGHTQLESSFHTIDFRPLSIAPLLMCPYASRPAQLQGVHACQGFALRATSPGTAVRECIAARTKLSDSDLFNEKSCTSGKAIIKEGTLCGINLPMLKCCLAVVLPEP